MIKIRVAKNFVALVMPKSEILPARTITIKELPMAKTELLIK